MILTEAKRELADGTQAKNEPTNPRPELFKIVLLALGVIVYQQTKGKKDVIVPMHFHLLEHLNYLAKFGTKGLLCPTLAKAGLRFVREVKRCLSAQQRHWLIGRAMGQCPLSRFLANETTLRPECFSRSRASVKIAFKS